MFELKLSQDLDEGPGVIPDASRVPFSIEQHSPGKTLQECLDRIEGWRLRHSRKMRWVVVWHNEPVACCFKRQWARDLIAELKVRYVMES